MAKSPCRLLLQVNHALVVIFHVTNLSFNAIRENKILAKISEFTVLFLRFLSFHLVYFLCCFEQFSFCSFIVLVLTTSSLI